MAALLSGLVNFGVLAALLYTSGWAIRPPSGRAQGHADSIATFSLTAQSEDATQGAQHATKATKPVTGAAPQVAQALVRAPVLVTNPAAGGSGSESAATESGVAVASSGAAAGTLSSAASAAATSDYPHALLEHIRPFFHYPDLGAARPEGPPRIAVSLDRGGHVLRVWLVDSSGSGALDEAALDAVRRSDPMPPIPQSLPDRLAVVVPVDFSRPRLVFVAGNR